MTAKQGVPLQRWLEIGTMSAALVGGYLFMVDFRGGYHQRFDRQEQRFDVLEAELLAIAETERLRDNEWSDDDERRYADWDIRLNQVRVTQDLITSSLAEQAVLLATLTRDGDSRGSPARAGIDPRSSRRCRPCAGLPRTGGDRPPRHRERSGRRVAPPHGRG